MNSYVKFSGIWTLSCSASRLSFMFVTWNSFYCSLIIVGLWNISTWFMFRLVRRIFNCLLNNFTYMHKFYNYNFFPQYWLCLASSFVVKSSFLWSLTLVVMYICEGWILLSITLELKGHILVALNPNLMFFYVSDYSKA